MSPLLTSLLAYGPILFLSYKLVIYIQRIYFHPLSRFPGPKFLAVSRLYEFYWDSIQHGRFWTRLPLLHQKYGPIIRIGPEELHIQDSEYYKELFSFKPLDKWAISAREFNLNYAMFGTEEYKLYVKRRAGFGDAFGKGKSLGIQPLIREKMDKGEEKMREAAKRGKSIDLAYLYRAITAEIITEYMYGQQYGFFEDVKTTKGLYDRRFDVLFGMTHLGRFIPFWIPLVLILVRAQVKSYFGSQEGMASVLSFQKFADKMLKNVVDEHGIQQEPDPNKEYKTVASVYLHSNLPTSDKTGAAISQATMAAWSGGWDTTAFGLTLASYLLLMHPAVNAKLQAELQTAWPKADEEADMSFLENLPYLNAVLKESMRHMHGVLTRLTRINPTQPEIYGKYTIPPNTKISMSMPDVNLDPSIWGSDVHIFRPERWLGHPELDQWLATFSRGTRVCAGIELAWVELKMILATLVRRFPEMKIDGSQGVGDADILPYCDGHTPGPKNLMQRLPVLLGQ